MEDIQVHDIDVFSSVIIAGVQIEELRAQLDLPHTRRSPRQADSRVASTSSASSNSCRLVPSSP